MIKPQFLDKNDLLKIEGRSEKEYETPCVSDNKRLLAYVFWLHDKIRSNPLRPHMLDARRCDSCDGLGVDSKSAFCTTCNGYCFL